MFIKDTLFMYSKKILLVDDDIRQLAIAEDCFRREQVEIITAEDGLQAVAATRREKPDLVSMDLYMPNGDGDLACREIKQDHRLKFTPVVMMTEGATPEDVERCFAAGCDDVIHKPLTRTALLDVSKRLVKFPGWSGKRAPIKTPVKPTSETLRSSAMTLADISVGGVFMETDDLLPVGAELDFQFQLNPERQLSCRGRVAWVKGGGEQRKAASASTGMGFEFIDIKKLDILSIQAWVSRSL
jgi:CheY-like chemotaxis protein